MATTKGTVEKLKLSSFRGFVEIRRTDGVTPPVEVLIIWYGDESRGPSALWTSELTTAMARGLEVSISHADDGAYIEDLTIYAPVP